MGIPVKDDNASNDAPSPGQTVEGWAPVYVARGWAVIPLHHMIGPRCSCPMGGEADHSYRQGGKHPLWREWQHNGMRTIEAIRGYWSAHPSSNVGVVTGRASGFFALDVDPDNGGLEALDALEGQYGRLPPTRVHRTGSGGFHHLFAMPEFELTNSNALPRGLDIRGDGGQIVVPPSVSGKGVYEVEDSAEIADAPEWLLNLIRPRQSEFPRDSTVSMETWNGSDGSGSVDRRAQAYAQTAITAEWERLAQALEGERNNTAFAVACRLHELINAGWVDAGWLRGEYDKAIEACGLGWTEGASVWNKAASKVGVKAAVLPPELSPGGAGIAYEQLGGVPPFSPSAAGGGSQLPPSSTGEHYSTSDGYDAVFEHRVQLELVKLRAIAEAKRRYAIERRATELGGHYVSDVNSMLAEVLDTDSMDAIPALVPLVDGLLMRDTLARVNGPSGHGKSFLALDLAACVATGTPWHGRQVAQGNVVYLLAEGAPGFKKRMRAWERHHGRAMTGVKVIPRPIQVDGPEWDVLAQVVAKLDAVMVVVDTQARATVGINENDATEMGVAIDALERLRRASGATVLSVHHTGHEGERGRGSSAVKGAMQTELTVSKTGKVVKLGYDKQKDDDDEIPAIEFTMQSIDLPELGTSRDGSPVSSVVLLERKRIGPVGVASDPDPVEFTGKLNAVMAEVFATGHGGTKAEVKSVVIERGLMGKSRFYTAWNDLLAMKNIGKIHGTNSWRYIPIEDREKVVEPVGHEPGNPGAYYAPNVAFHE